MERHPRLDPVAIAITLMSLLAVVRLLSIPWLRIPTRDVAGWLSQADPETIAAALLVHGAMAAVLAMAVSVVSSLPRALLGLPPAARALASRWRPRVRRLTNRVAVGTITLTSLLPQLAAAREQSPGLPIADAVDRTVSPGYLLLSPVDAHRSAHVDSIRVEPGDTLWAIAANHLERGTRREPSAAEISRHWRAIIDLNIDRLRSGDPDLIHPGEDILLPPAAG